MTAPSWDQFWAGKDSNGDNFQTSITNQTAGKNVTASINITGLTNNTVYTVYFGGSNSNFPRLYTASVYAVQVTTANSSSTGGGGNTVYGEKLITGIFMILISLLALILG